MPGAQASSEGAAPSPSEAPATGAPASGATSTPPSAAKTKSASSKSDARRSRASNRGGWTPEPGAAPPEALPLTPTVPFAATLSTTAYDGSQVSPDPPRPEEVTRRQAEYLLQRFDLSGRTHPTVLMSGGTKAIPSGPTARLPAGLTWEHLSNMSPTQMRKRKAFPFTPLWHPLQEVGGMVFPPVQTGRVSGLERVDVWFDLPETYTPEFPPPLYLTSRPDLGDVSQGQLITLENADLLFHDILTPTQLHGLKLMLKKMPARHHNQSDQRSTSQPVAGVACMDCHVNGHTAAQFSLTADMRPQSERFRVDTASLRGSFARSWFGYKRALPALEQFIQSEAVSAYFEGDASLAELHGAQGFSPEDVAAMAQFIRLIDFPPAPKLDPNGNLDRRRASDAELRGERVFEQHCRGCHSGFYFTDNVAHDLKVERFYDHVGSTRHGVPGRAEGPIRTPSLRGVKDSPPYLHDGRLLTLEDAVEFFNLVLQAKLSRRQRADLVEYLRAL